MVREHHAPVGGDVPAGGAAVAAWTMLCSRNGTFEENMAADISHADELGGSVTSLIRDVTTHLLFRQVQIDSPGRDYNLPCVIGVLDFFATLLDDDVVTVDGMRGVVYGGNVKLVV